MYYQAVFAALLLLNAPILWYKHRWNRIMDTRVIKETAPGSDPVRLGRADVGGDSSGLVPPSPSSFPRRPRPSLHGSYPTPLVGPDAVARVVTVVRVSRVGGSHRCRTGRHGRRSIGGDCSTRVHRHRGLVGRGPLQENITAPKRIGIPRRNLQASRQRPAPVCSGNGGDLPAV